MTSLAKRLLAVVPLVLAAGVVALTIVMMVAGRTPSAGDTGYWLSLNASKVGQDTIVLNTATPGQANPTDPLGILPALDGLFGGLVNNITGMINQGITDLSDNLIGNLTRGIGVRDVYNFYLTGLCEGMYVNANDANSAVTITKCASYTDQLSGLRNISRSIPSYFVIGNTNVSVPLIEGLAKTTDTLSTLGQMASAVILTLLALSCAAAALTLLGSAAAAALGYRRLLLMANAVAAAVAAVILQVFALAGTAVSLVTSEAVSGFGGAFSLSTRTGKAFLAEAWAAAVLGLLVANFWGTVWFVEGRRHAFRRRPRTSEQMGDYRGILKEVVDDWKLDPHGPPPEEREKEKEKMRMASQAQV